MTDEVVTVDIVANPRPFMDGMQQVETSAVNTASVIDASMQRVIRDTEAIAKSARTVNDSLGASARDFMAQARQLDVVLESQSKNLADVANKQAQLNSALKIGILTEEEYALAAAKVSKEHATLQKAADASTKSIKGGAAATHELSLGSAAAQRELGVLAGELLRGNFAAFERSAITLTRQVGLLQMAFSATGLAIAAGVAVVGFAVSSYMGAQARIEDFNRTLLLSGNYAGQTAQSMGALREEIGAQTGKYNEAEEALKALASSGRITSESFADAARGTVEFAELSQQSAATAAKAYESIFKDPTKAAEDLNQQMHFLTLAQYEHIKNLEEEGNKTQAAAELTKLFTAALDSRYAEYHAHQTELQKLWESIGGAIDTAKEKTAGFMNQLLQLKSGDLMRIFASPGAAIFGALNAKPDWSNVVAGAGASKEVVEALNAAMVQTGIEADKSIDKIVKQYGKAATAGDRLKEVQTQLYNDFLNGGTLPKGMNLDLSSGTPKFSGPTWDAIAEKILNAGKAARQSAADMKAINSVMSELDNSITAGIRTAEQLNTEYTGPVAAAYAKYQKQVETLTKALDALQAKAAVDPKFAASDKFQTDLGELNLALTQAAQNFDLVKARANALSQVLLDAGTPVQQLVDKYKEEEAALSSSSYAHERVVAEQHAEAEVRRAVAETIKQSTDATGAEQAALVAELPHLIEVGKAHVQLTENLKQQMQVSREWQQIVSSGLDGVSNAIGDLVASGFSDWSNFGKSLLNTTKQFISQMISEFLKLAVFNGIINSLFGTNMPTMGSGGGGGMGWMSVIGSVLGSQGGAVGAAGEVLGAAGGGGGSGGGAGNMISLGQSLWSGFQNGWSGYFTPGASAGSTIFGSYSGAMGGVGPYAPSAGGSQLGLVPDYGAGAPGSIGVAPGSYSYTPSTLGYAAAGVAGVYAGYNRWEGSNKDLGGGLGAAAYGVGTYYAAIGAGAALSGGVAAGMAAIPVVGWIALAAMVVDMASGGKLFGTSANKFADAAATLNVNGQGASFENTMTLTGQKAFFGGKYWRESHPEETEAQRKAAEEFFKQLQDESTKFAKFFGATMGEVATGSFTQHFDKQGNPTGKTETTINGHTFKDETQEQFSTRIVAESYVLDLEKLGVKVRVYTEGFVNDADKYAAAVQDTAQAISMAQADLKNGLDVTGGQGRGGMTASTLQDVFDTIMKFNDDAEGMTATYSRLQNEAENLANGMYLLTGQKSVEDIEAFLRTIQRFGESVTDVYQRVAQATQTYYQTIGGVESSLGAYKQQTQTGTAVGQFADSMAQIDANMKATIKTLNDAAKAAGLQGAREEDLAHVHQLAAIQAAGAIAQLVAAGRSVANQLYGTNPSLEELNQRIAELQGQANSSSASVRGFGGAMTDAANAAKAAMDLLLGDLSPLNDMQKLQQALQGQMQGLVAPDQVLQIGRRLYASSQAYTDLYNQVTAIGDRTQHGGGDSRGGGLSEQAQGNLADLIRQRDELEKQQRASQARELASIVANLAYVQQESYEDISKELNFSLADLAKDLGMTQDQLNQYLDNIKAQENAVPDALDSNFDRLINFLADIFDVPAPTSDEPGSPTAHSGHGRPDVSAPDPGSNGYGGHTRAAGAVPQSPGGAAPSKSDKVPANDEGTQAAVAEVKTAVATGSDAQVAATRELGAILRAMLSLMNNDVSGSPRNLRTRQQ